MPASEPAYALYHVHRVTGERVRYPLTEWPPMERAKAEDLALDSRISQGRGSSDGSLWETRALPEGSERAGTEPGA